MNRAIPRIASRPGWRTFLVLLLLGLAASGEGKNNPPASAGGGDLLNLDWRVYVAGKPSYCILVEKDRQLLRVLRHDGRIQVVAEYVAATGENFGPKEEEGDAKTPEGVYFITKTYLDRKMSVFGNRAFHLNYPNYFDTQQGRGGNGIFIHGTNRPLRLSSSNGCVTLANKDLDSLSAFLELNPPIFIVPSLAKLRTAKDSPNLTANGFAGAKALLIADGGVQVDFASLYLISINDQTVVAGEYWPGPGGEATLRKAVAYLGRNRDGSWFAADRGPAWAPPAEASAALLPVGVEGGEESDLEPAMAGAALSEPSLVEAYLAWRRESMTAEQGLQAASPASGSATATPREGLLYGLFIVASLTIVGCAAVMISRQEARPGGADPETMEERRAGEELAQAARLQEEVRQAMESLQAVREQIGEEAAKMERQEALEARVEALEGELLKGEAVLAGVAAEQATWKEARELERVGSVEMISALRLDVEEVRRQVNHAHEERASAAVFSGQVQDQLAGITKLLSDQHSTLQEALQGVLSDHDRGAVKESEIKDIRVVLEALRCDLLSEKAGAAFLESQIIAQAEEIKALRESSAHERGELEATVSSLRCELATIEGQASSSRQEAESLRQQLGQLDKLTEAVQARDSELATLRESSAHERGELEATVSSLRSDLEARDRQWADAEAAKRHFEASLAEVVLSSQVEIAHARNMLKTEEDKAAVEQARRVELNHRLEEVTEDLRQATERESAIGELVRGHMESIAELRAENANLKAKLQEIGNKSSGVTGEAPGREVSSLPADVLRKWMGKG